MHESLFKLSSRNSIHYEMSEPVFLPMEADLVKRILVTDFDHFVDLGFFDPAIYELTDNHLGLANTLGEDWKKLKSEFATATFFTVCEINIFFGDFRASVTPAFTLKNLRNVATDMLPIAKESVEVSTVGVFVFRLYPYFVLFFRK